VEAKPANAKCKCKRSYIRLDKLDLNTSMITMVSVRLTHETVLKLQNRTGILQTVCIANHRIKETMDAFVPEHAIYHMNQSCKTI
jgi:hypothetical protein